MSDLYNTLKKLGSKKIKITHKSRQYLGFIYEVYSDHLIFVKEGDHQSFPNVIMPLSEVNAIEYSDEVFTK